MSMAPLEGIVVLDFTNNGAGPACSMLLGDFGADVIKVEPPQGDATRAWGATRMGERGQFTPTYISLNRNKSSIALDLKSEEGKAAVQALMANADVIIESFSPGVAARLGIGYEEISKKRPEVVYCSVSGFGQSGPLTERPGFDNLLQAFCGHMSLTGEPGRPSVRNGPSSIDYLTGAHAAFGIMVALRHRDLTGKGQWVDSCLFDNAIYLVGNHLTDAMATKRIPGKMGSHFALMAPYGVFRASDREFYIGVSSDLMWQKLCEAAGRPDLAADPRFARNADRLNNRAALHEEVGRMFVAKPAQHWINVALSLGIPHSLVRDLGEVAQDEHMAARGLLYDSGIEGVRTVGTPFKMSLTPGTHAKRAPALDADRESILKRLG
jgi:crotonobetainyl-CoA:carnitine CoA-transferase CaiB-like acyl-CoA transferase